MKLQTYDLSFDVDYTALKYSGRVRMTLEDAPADLTINAVDLTLLKVVAGGTDIRWEKGTDEEEIVLKGIPSGSKTIDILFEAKVAEQVLSGFYKSRFGAGYLLTTQFESTQARRMFPCIDHPAYKAVFNVELTVGADLDVVFNTPIASESPLPGGKKLLKFQPTPRMSTYLVYFGIGKIAEVSRDHGKLKVIVALPEEKKGSAGFALDHAGPSVEYFERYYGIPYPLPKLHLISVPDTWVGAMENWGAISFRELALLVDSSTSAMVKRQVALTIAHEIAHQWFGDLVTMAWWNDLWLNESFATFLAYKAVAHLHPEWKVWNDFLSDSTARALLWDALVTTHPIEANVVHPVDIDEAFDEISYEKGGAVLRMLESYIGEEEFARGVSAYLTRFQYSNAQSTDLWKTLEEVTGVPVPEIMGAWIRRRGYPIVTAKLEGNKLHLSQHRFMLEGSEQTEPWPIPVTLRVDGREQRLLMKQAEHTIELPLGSTEVVVNTGRAGYYRVRYEGALGTALHNRIERLEEADRWGIVQDTYASLLAGTLSPQGYLELVQRLKGDESTLVTEEIVTELSALLPMIEGLEKYRKTFQEMAKAQLDKFGMFARPGESHSVKSIRERLALLRAFVDRDFARELDARFGEYNTLEPEARTAVIVAHALVGGEKEYQEVENLFLNSVSEGESWRCSLALASFRQGPLFERALGLLFKQETGLGRALPLLSNALSLGTRTEEGREVLWKWMHANLDAVATATQGSAIFSMVMQAWVSRGGLRRPDAMREYVNSRTLPGGESGKAKGLELLKVYERLLGKFRDGAPA
jgi:tricorn protease interacting factor F2/3